MREAGARPKQRQRRCSICGRPAVVYLAYARRSFCEEHFAEYIEQRVSKTIERYRLAGKDDLVVVAVSGGKDSSTLLKTLAMHAEKYGYRLLAVHLDLGLGEYSEKLRKAFQELVERLQVPGVVISVRDILGGDGVYELARKAKRPTCSVCGLVKRYLLNLVAVKAGATRIATGHNLDDILAYALRDFLYLDLDQLAKHGPSTETRGTAIGRIRPLYEVSEKETLLYAIVEELPFVHEYCPYRPEKPLEDVSKEYLNRLEEMYPGLKISMARRIAKYARRTSSDWEPGKCIYCGQPAQGSVCGFCKLTEKIYGEPKGPVASRYVEDVLEKTGLGREAG